MAPRRTRALERPRGLEGVVLHHLDEHIPATIHEAPTAIVHWRTEVNGFLDQMETLARHVGGRTSVEWQAKIRDHRRRMVELLGDE